MHGSRNKVFPLPLKCSQTPQTPNLLIVKSMLSPLTLCCFQYSINVFIFYHPLSWPLLQFCPTKGPRIAGKELNREEIANTFYLTTSSSPSHLSPLQAYVEYKSNLEGSFCCFLLFMLLRKIPWAIITPLIYNFHQCDSRKKNQNFIYCRKLRTGLGL